ncbi:hypothetical protein ID866_5984 [Astraeus odoratus]|nr:hypothetical protein ID866_5984 [Astraeus odoratus]
MDLSSPETRQRPDSNRENSKRRRRRKKKTPIVGTSAGGLTRNDVAVPSSRESACPTSGASSACNQIIRFPSTAPEAESSSSKSPAPESSTASSVASIRDADGDGGANKQATHPEERGDTPDSVTKSTTTLLDNKVAQLTQELAAKSELLASHQALLTQVQQTITCQICLELMHKPYALSPCGHLACHECLVQWFKAPLPDGRPARSILSRKKTCPHCRAIVRERPIEVWGVKSIVQAVAKSSLVPGNTSAAASSPENQNAVADPWGGIFPKIRHGNETRYHLFRGRGDDGGDADRAPDLERVGMLDMEDGGIYRCLDCMHEIWNGACTSCGREYPGHRNDEDDGEDLEWMDDEPGAEEVNIADDPGWIGLEGGYGDDAGDDDDDGPMFAPWPFFHDPYSLMMGTVFHDEDEDYIEDEEEAYGSGVYGFEEDYDEDEEDGYESDFIDDRPMMPYEGEGRIYEISDSDGEHGPSPDRQESPTPEAEDNNEAPRRSMRIRRQTAVVYSDDEDDEEESDVTPVAWNRSPAHSSRGRIIYSDESGAETDD